MNKINLNNFDLILLIILSIVILYTTCIPLNTKESFNNADLSKMADFDAIQSVVDLSTKLLAGNVTIDHNMYTMGNINISGDLTVNTPYSCNLLPPGIIVMWHGDITKIPPGWALCNGVGSTPNLQGKFILGTNNYNEIGTTGGSTTDTITIKPNNIPSHIHQLMNCSSKGDYNQTGLGGGDKHDGGGLRNDKRSDQVSWISTAYGGTTDPTKGDPIVIPILPAYYQLDYIIKI